MNGSLNARAGTSPDRVLGIDLGTSYFKVGLFSLSGVMKGLGRVPTPATAPAAGQCEMAPEAFVHALRQALDEALGQDGTRPEQIRALSYSSQANSFLLVDAAGHPLTPLLLWPDTRAGIQPASAALWARADFVEHTGIGVALGPSTAVNKLLALRAALPGSAAAGWRMMTISDYLVWLLTGRFAGDGGTACLLGLEAVRAVDWWPAALSALDLEPSRLMRLQRPGARIGAVSPEGARLFGLPAGIPLAAGSLDHYMAAIGAGVGTVASLSESSGTVMACLRRTPRFAPRAGCCIGPDTDEGFFELAFDGNGGAVLEWYQHRLPEGANLAQLDREADAVAPGSGGLRARPKAHLLSDTDAFTGRRPEHGRGHEMRALLESVTATLCDKIAVLCGGEPPQGVIATGGGARSPVWMQLKADMLGARFFVPDCPEPACRGAALTAAILAGAGDTPPDALTAAWQPAFAVYRPRPDFHAFYQRWRTSAAEDGRGG